MIIGLQQLSVFQVSNRQSTTLISSKPISPLPSPLPLVIDPLTTLAGGGLPGSPSAVLDITDTTGLKTQAQLWFMFLPILTPFVSSSSPQYTIAILDSSNLDDAIDNTTYVFRMEEIQPNRVPTVRRVILEYRDLGICNVNCLITGTNDKGEVIFVSNQQKIGNTIPTGTILTSFFDITLTAFRPQVAFTRSPGSGPLAIISTTLIGESEQVTL